MLAAFLNIMGAVGAAVAFAGAFVAASYVAEAILKRWGP